MGIILGWRGIPESFVVRPGAEVAVKSQHWGEIEKQKMDEVWSQFFLYMGIRKPLLRSHRRKRSGISKTKGDYQQWNKEKVRKGLPNLHFRNVNEKHDILVLEFPVALHTKTLVFFSEVRNFAHQVIVSLGLESLDLAIAVFRKQSIIELWCSLSAEQTFKINLLSYTKDVVWQI